MVTVVRHRKTGNEYILLGINGEGNKATPSRFISELFAQEKSEVSTSATVCDVRGNIFLAYIDDLIVTEIDGIEPAEILSEPIPPVPNDVDREQPEDYEEELEDEDFADESEEVRAEPLITPVYSQDKPSQDDFDEDDEDWI